VIGRLNAMMLRLLPDETATLCLLRIDPRTGAGFMANAGHLPPVLRSPDGPATFVAGGTALLGVGVDRGPGTTFQLPAGGTLVMVTDGLIERRTENLGVSLEQLRLAIQAAGPDLEDLCDGLLAEFVTEPLQDDVAIVAIRRSP
jgi:serine phosphatase RsbU (regulator of sigma subunit)